jgi:hypothetical protein
MDEPRKSRTIDSEGFAMVAAVHSVAVWAGLILLALCVTSLVYAVDGAANRAARASAWGVLRDLLLIAHGAVIGLIASAMLYWVYFGGSGRSTLY